MAVTQIGPLAIDNGEGWTFLNGPWRDGANGEVGPPDGSEVEYLAIREQEAFADFEASFRFRLRHITSVRFLFRVQDSRRFYALDIPFGGQQFRGRACWAGMIVADGTPLQRFLNFGLVPGLCATLGRWYEVRVRAVGPRLQAWIDDIPVADVEDDTYSSGRIGLGSLQSPYPEAPRFDRVCIGGELQDPPDWPGLEAPTPHWITPCPEPEPGTYQSYASLIKSNSGAATLYLTFGNPNAVETLRAAFIRSQDGGRTWGPQEPATLERGFGGPFVRRDGTWVCLHTEPDDPDDPDSLLVAFESGDQGLTWSGPEALRIEGGWPGEWKAGGAWRVVRMSDGALVAPIMVTPSNEPQAPTQCPFWTSLALHSEDDGHTWSAPVLCDADAKEAPAPPAMLRYAARYY